MPKRVRKKRRFIDPKHASKFVVVNRSQRDPLTADHAAPQRVLKPIVEEGDGDDDGLSLLEARREEQRGYGVYFDDEYDYLQHLREPGFVQTELERVGAAGVDRRSVLGFGRGAKSTISNASTASSKPMLPSSVFESEFEEEIGLLERGAPHSGPLVGLDPDVLEVLETLDDAYDVQEVVHGKELAHVFAREEDGREAEAEEEVEVEEGDLDDILADIVHGEEEARNEEEEEDFDTDDDDDDRFPFGNDEEYETRSRFTEYSISSSVVPRSEQMVILDEKFEKFFDKYDEEETGALDLDEIEGHRAATSEVMDHILKEYEQQKASERQRPEIRLPDEEDQGESDDAGDETELVEVEAPKERWDCESIISTYSNIYHHPKLISEPSKKHPAANVIKISGKNGMPKDVLGKGLTASALRQLDAQTGVSPDDSKRRKEFNDAATLASRVSELSFRNKHETLDEKRDRKRAFKDHKRERREERKANKAAFREERERQVKAGINKRNLQGQRLL